MKKHMFCLMVTGLPLTDDDRFILLEIAGKMLKKGSAGARLKTTEMEGFVTTKFRTVSVGSKSGTVFEAMVESNRGKSTVRFLVNPKDVGEDYSWQEVTLDDDYDLDLLYEPETVQ